MRIGLDGTPIAAQQRTGIGTYTRELLLAMARRRPQHHFVVPFLDFVGRRGGVAVRRGSSAPVQAANITLRPVRWMPGRVYAGLQDRGRGPALDRLAGAPADFYLFPTPACPPMRSTRRLGVVIHDLAYLDTPEHVPDALRTALERAVPRALRTAEVVVAVSATTRTRLAQAYGHPGEQVVVVPPSVDHQRFFQLAPERIASVTAAHGLEPGGYVLFVGTKEPRKNLQGLARAYRALPDPLRRRVPLVLAGAPGWLDDDLQAELRRAAAAGRVIDLGYLPAADLPALLGGAGVFAYPSFYEGWGMPVLEAMACGAPVITSTCSALPEAAGGAALLVDPHDADAMAAAVQAVLEDDILAARLRAAGPRRAAGSTWDVSAERLLGAIEAPAAAAVGSDAA